MRGTTDILQEVVGQSVAARTWSPGSISLLSPDLSSNRRNL